MRLQPSYYDKFSAEDFALDERFQQWILNPDEENSQFWVRFLETSPDKKNTIEEAKQLVLDSGLTSDAEANQAFLGIWKNLENHAHQSIANEQNSSRTRYTMLAAACISIVVVVSYFLWNRTDKPFEEFHTAYGESRTITLHDGSIVMLNSNSTLKYLSDFRGERKVLLQGEAFFNVAKSKDQKFIVHTEESVDTEVLGTEFNVKTGRGNIEVYLKEGSVKITSPANHVTLTPGEKATYDKSTRAVTVAGSTSAQAEDLLGWMHKVFIYDDEPLDAIVQEIESYYGVTISFSERSLADRRFTGKIPGQSLDVTLEVLSKTLELSIENKGDEIVIKPLSE